MSEQVISLVATNGVVTLFTVLVCIVYRYVYPRKKISPIVLIVALGMLATISYWRQGVFESGDFVFHAMELTSFFESIRSGIIFPRWASGFCAGFGYPHFSYFYLLPYYFGSLFHLIGFSLISSMKLVFVGSFLTAGIGSYLWLREHFSPRSALLGSILYLFAPYHLINLHFKHAIGENLSFALAPVILFCVVRYCKTRQLKWLAVFILGYCMLIFTHLITPLLLVPLVVGYVITLVSQDNKCKPAHLFLLGALCLSFLLTAVYWLPILLDSSLLQQSSMRVVLFPEPQEFLFAPWRLGFLFQGSYGETASLVGYSHVLVLIFASLIAIKNRVTLFFLVLAFFSILFMQEWFKPIWELLPIVQNFQFSTRLFFIVVIATAFLGGATSEYFLKRKSLLIFLFSVFTVGYTFLNWGNRGTLSAVTDTVVAKELPLRCDRVGLPITANEQAIRVAAVQSHDRVVISSGTGTIVVSRYTPQLHEYQVLVNTPSVVITEQTLYFPNWKLFIDGIETKIKVTEVGLMAAEISSGSHLLQFTYEQRQSEVLGKEISKYTLIVLILGLLKLLFFYPKTH